MSPVAKCWFSLGVYDNGIRADDDSDEICNETDEDGI